MHWIGKYGGGPQGNITSFNIEFYLDDGSGQSPTGGPGDPTATAIATYNIAGDGNETDNLDGTFSYWVDLPVAFEAAAGVHYWISIQSVSDFPPQWLWQVSNTQQLAEAVAGFPLLGFDYWTPLSEITGAPTDMAFMLTGTIIPTPGAFALFGLAGLLSTRRRHR